MGSDGWGVVRGWGREATPPFLGVREASHGKIVLEAVFLTIIAGVIGIIVGALLLFVINVGTANLEEFPFTNPTVPLAIVFGAFITMITLGTLIGLIPAERAVSIKPIEALREE